MTLEVLSDPRGYQNPAKGHEVLDLYFLLGKIAEYTVRWRRAQERGMQGLEGSTLDFP